MKITSYAGKRCALAVACLAALFLPGCSTQIRVSQLDNELNAGSDVDGLPYRPGDELTATRLVVQPTRSADSSAVRAFGAIIKSACTCAMVRLIPHSLPNVPHDCINLALPSCQSICSAIFLFLVIFFSEFIETYKCNTKKGNLFNHNLIFW